MKVDNFPCCLSWLIRFYVYSFFPWLSALSGGGGEVFLHFSSTAPSVTDPLTSSSRSPVILPHREDLAMSGDIFCYYINNYWEVPLESSGWRPGMFLNILQCMERFQQRIIWLQMSLITSWKLRNYAPGQTGLVGATRQPTAQLTSLDSYFCFVLALRIFLLSGNFIHKLIRTSELF